MITEIVESMRAQLDAALIEAGSLVDVVKYSGFINVDPALEAKLLLAVRFIDATPAGKEPGTGETLATLQLGVLIRHRLDDDAYDLVVDAAEFVAAWLKWNRFEIAQTSGRGAVFSGIRSVSQEFGTPVLEVTFSLGALLQGYTSSAYPFGPALGGMLRRSIQEGPGLPRGNEPLDAPTTTIEFTA